MSQMDELIAFLGARLDEDEQAARAASRGPWFVTHDPLGTHVENGDGVGRIVQRSGRDRLHDDGAEENAAHIARHDPARVLREVEAKRRILDLHKVGRYGECETCDVGAQSCGCCGWGESPCDTVRLLALPYADQPNYRQEWATPMSSPHNTTKECR